MKKMKLPEHLVFGLDIGTRSIVGSVGYFDGNKFNVAGHCVKEHETRAMMDGQIHDIGKVGETICAVKKQLENQVERTLDDVCIAAAGRVLKTVTVHVDMDRIDDGPTTEEEIYSLDMLGVEKAYDIIRADYPDVNFYCVGYTVVKYYMNGYIMGNLEGHKGKTVGADILATFLPNEVIDDLYSATAIAELNVANLTLEPIAAINIAIPEKYRLLNIALVDVGAGTSDICVTKDGSIIAYGMIPHAGDEITESIVQHCLCDFDTAEHIKRASVEEGALKVTYTDIMGLDMDMDVNEVYDIYADIVDNMTKEIADKIIELNGGKSVNAVFVVGGGGKAHGFTECLAKHLGIPKQRVALRGEEVLGDVNFLMGGVKKDPLLVTPIGICMNYYNQKNHFIFVNINDERIKLYDNDQLTVVDAAMQIGFPNDSLFPKRGKSINFTLNGKVRMIRGELGEPARITINDHEASINSKIAKNDRIVIEKSTAGAPAKYTVGQLSEYRENINFIVNGMNISCPKFADVNGELVPSSYSIKNGDIITIRDYYTVSQVVQFMDIDLTGKKVIVNTHQADMDEPVYAGFRVSFETADYNNDDDNSETAESTESVENTEAAESVDIADNSDNKTNPISEKNDENLHQAEEKKSNNVKDIIIIVNGTPVTLKNKSSYTFVDILDYYPFDTKTAGGSDLIIKINDQICTFMSPLKDGDITEIYWK